MVDCPADFAPMALARLGAALPNARLWGCVRACGPALAAQFAALHAAEGFAVTEAASAAALRRLGWRGLLALLPGVADARGLEDCSRLGLWHGVADAAQVDWLAAHKCQLPQQVLLVAGAGGVGAQHLRSRYTRLAALPQVESVLLWAQVPEGAAAPATMAALEAVSADWIGQRSLVLSVALTPAWEDQYPALHTLAEQAETQGWDLELLCSL